MTAALAAAREPRQLRRSSPSTPTSTMRPPGSGVWWEVIGAEVTNDETTRRVVDEREEGRIHQRFHYQR